MEEPSVWYSWHSFVSRAAILDSWIESSMRKPARVVGFGMNKLGVFDHRVPCIVANAVC